MSTKTQVKLGDLDLRIVPGSLRKRNANAALPKISISSEAKTYADLMNIDIFGQQSFHHGRGEKDFSDPYAYFDGTCDTRIKGQVLNPGKRNQVSIESAGGTDFNGYISSSVWFASNLYFLIRGNAAANNALYVWDNTGSEMDAVSAGIDTSTGVPGDMKVFAGDLFVAQGEAVNMWTYDTSATAWQDGSVPAVCLEVHEGRLWRSDNINEVYYSANPGADSPTWSGPIYIGDTNTYIRGLDVVNDRIIVTKEDGAWVIENRGDATTPNYQAYRPLNLSFIQETDNGRGHAVFQGFFYFNTMFGLLRYDGTSVEDVGPDKGAHAQPLPLVQAGYWGRDIPLAGEPSYQGYTNYGKLTSLTASNNWLYAVIDAGARTSSILAYGGSGWHPITQAAAANKRIKFVNHTAALAAAGVLSKPNIWWSEDDSIYYMVRPEGTENPDDYTGSEYETSGTHITSWVSMDKEMVDKDFLSLTLISEHLTSAITIAVHYELDEVTGWLLLGAVSPVSPFRFSPAQEMTFPEWTWGRKIRFKFTLTGTSSVTPILHGYYLKYQARPNPAYSWEFLVQSASYQQTLESPHDLSQEEMSNNLWQMIEEKFVQSFEDNISPPARTNIIANPSSELDTNSDGLCDGWAETGTPVTTRSFKYSRRGLASQLVTCGASGTQGICSAASIGVTASTTYEVSADVFVSSGNTVTMKVYDVDHSAFLSGSVTFVAADSRFRRKGFVFTTPAGCTNVKIYVERLTGDASATTVFYVDGVMMAAGAKVTPYFDGDTTRCYWEFGPHASRSFRPADYNVFVSDIGEQVKHRSEVGDIETVLPVTLVEAI